MQLKPFGSSPIYPKQKFNEDGTISLENNNSGRAETNNPYVQLNPYPHGLLNELKPTGGGSKGPPYQKHSKRLVFVTKLSTEVGSEVNFR